MSSIVTDFAVNIGRDFAESAAEKLAAQTAERGGVGILERLGVTRAANYFGRTVETSAGRAGGFLVRATDKIVTPGRIVAVGAGGSLVITGLGINRYLQNVQSVNLGLGGLDIRSFGNSLGGGGGSPFGDAGPNNPPNSGPSLGTVAVGGAAVVVLALGALYLLSRKKK